MKLKNYLPFGKPSYSQKEISAVLRVMESGWVGMGEEVISFENELSSYISSPSVVTVNSCTSALFLSLLVSGIVDGDEVICPSLTWCSTANAALYLRAVPVFCDINKDTLCVDAESILSKVTSKTRAVIVVHYGGYAVDVKSLREKLRKDIVIIEDAAHAFGAHYDNGGMMGSSGNLTCFSFYANKNISTGDGGAISVFDRAQKEKLMSLRQHALPIDAWKRFTNPNSMLISNRLDELGYKMNYTDLQASIGRAQLMRFKEMQKIRQEIAEIYYYGLQGKGIIFQSSCILPAHAKHLFAIRLPLEKLKCTRDEAILFLRSRNIGASVHYAPLHVMPLYLDRQKPASLEVTETAYEALITLPISASMSSNDANYVVKSVSELLSENYNGRS